MNMERFEKFDLKICKLTGEHWDRQDLRHLATQLMEEQGNARHSIENRVILVFDKSPTSRVEFFELNRQLLIEALISIAHNPTEYTYWLPKFECWIAIKLFQKDEYQLSDDLADYYQHPIDLGMRERLKAAFERKLVLDVSRLCDFKIRPNIYDPFVRGKDGELKIDSEKLKMGRVLQWQLP
jgi:hypothetical protein